MWREHARFWSRCQEPSEWTETFCFACGSCRSSFIRPYLFVVIAVALIYGVGSLEITWTGNGTTTAVSTQHILSIQSKCRSLVLNDIFVLSFLFFSCFWNTVLFGTLLFGNTVYLEWFSGCQPKTWVVFSVLSAFSLKSHFYHCWGWAYKYFIPGVRGGTPEKLLQVPPRAQCPKGRPPQVSTSDLTHDAST